MAFVNRAVDGAPEHCSADAGVEDDVTAFQAPLHRSAQFRVAVDPTTLTPMSHVVNDVPCELRAATLIEALERGAAEDRLYLDLLDGRNRSHEYTYADVLAGARRWAAHFAEFGLRRGARIVLLLPTGADFVFAFFGAQIAGGVPVPCAPPFTFGGLEKYVANLKHIVRNCGAEVFVTNARFKKAIGAVLSDRNAIRHLVLAGEVPEGPVPDALRFAPVAPQDVAFLQYTSGTTGQPKGVVLTHANLVANVHGIGLGLGMCRDDVGMSWLPLFHDMGLIGVLFTCLYWQFPVHVMAPEHFILHPHRWLENITRFRVTLSPAPNLAYHLCMRRVTEEQFEKLDLSSWRIALNGAEPVDAETVARFQERFSKVGFGAKVLFPVYGMAENSLAATFPDIEQPYVVRRVDRVALEQEGRVALAPVSSGDDTEGVLPYHAVSVGYPLAGQEISVVGDDGAILPQGRVGEILVRGPSVTEGYYENRKETRRVLKDGWLRTGDLGFVSERRLFVTGRKKEMIIRMGRNYYPYDIERVAASVDGIRKGCLAAFACQNAESGSEDIVLIAETREKDGEVRARIRKEINGELLGALGVRADQIVLAAPKTIPKTTSGKIQRTACRDRYLAGQLAPAGMRSIFGPFKSLVRSFLGHQAFRFRRRAGSVGSSAGRQG